jgi:hypothetical protein
MHDDLFDYAGALGNDGFLIRFCDFDRALLKRGKIGLTGSTVDGPAFDGDVLVTESDVLLDRVLNNPCKEPHAAALDYPLPDLQLLLHDRDPDLALSAATWMLTLTRSCL